MPKPGTKDQPASGGSRPSGQQKGATEGAAGRSVTKGPNEPGRLVPTDAAKQILERHGNDPVKLAEHLASLEPEMTKKSQALARATEVIQQLEGLSDFVERDPVSGRIRLKTEAVTALAGGKGNNGGDAAKKFRDDLASNLKTKLSVKDADLGAAFVDTMLEASQFIAKGIMAELKGELGTLKGNSQLGIYLLENPHLAPIAPHIQTWLDRQPKAVRDSISIEDAALIVVNRLKKAGNLSDDFEATGEETVDTRKKTALTGGDSGGEDETQQSEEKLKFDKKIKDDIKNSGSAFDKFIQGSRNRALGQDIP